MKNLIYFILILPTLLFADPFYGDDLNHNKKENSEIHTSARSQTYFSTCPLPEERNELNLAIGFEELKLIGIVKKNNKIKALFIDKDNQIFDFSTNDFLKESLIQFTEINLKQVKYINWALTENCNTPYEITLKI